MGILAELEQRLEATDVAVAGSAVVSDLMRQVRAGQRRLEGQAVRLAQRATELDQAGSGMPATDVLRGAGEVSSREARKQAKRAEVAGELPALGRAVKNGEARSENVDAVARATAHLNDDERERLRAIDVELADRATNLPPEVFQRWIRRRVDAITADHGLAEFERQRVASRASTWVRRNGMHCLYAEWDPERGAAVHSAIEAEVKALARRAKASGDSVRINDHLRAEAAYRVLTRGNSGIASAPRVSISVITDRQTLESGPHPDSVCELWSGAPLAPQTLGRLCCDAGLTGIEISDDGLPLRVGAEHRTATPAQRKALRAIYDGCPLSGVPFPHCEIHHVIPFTDVLRTDIDELIPLSVEWHHRVHEGGWRIELDADRTLRVFRPNGRLDRTLGPPVPLTRRRRGPPAAAA